MRILEAGHFYAAKGPTAWSVRGWEILLQMRNGDDKSMLFIDDVHGLCDVSPQERALQREPFNPTPDFTVMESEVIGRAWEFLNRLCSLPRKTAAKMSSERWHCSGISLTNDRGEPNCVLLDAGLTLFKHELGAREGVNILPVFYEEQQRKLLRLLAKALPDFHLRVVLCDLEGNIWDMEPEGGTLTASVPSFAP